MDFESANMDMTSKIYSLVINSFYTSKYMTSIFVLLKIRDKKYQQAINVLSYQNQSQPRVY